MLDSISSLAAFGTQMSAQNTNQQLQVDVLKKAQDIQKQQGQDAVQLIANSTIPASGIDTHA
jgi:Putative motility protein